MATLDYQPRLDGIRAVAVALVLQQHFTSVGGRFGFGGLGVRIFFVLSGYLISRIIFDYSRRDISIQSASRQFYWRRFLRLTPPLCLAIGVSALLGISNMRADWLWHVSYLTNIKEYIDGASGPATHFWSLAVEEQFYLIWFFLLITTSLRNSVWLIFVGIAIGPLFRIGMLMAGQSFAVVLLPGTIDFFCLGALIAYAEFFSPAVDFKMRSVFAHPALVCLACCIVVISLAIPVPHSAIRETANMLADGLLSFCLIIAARNATDRKYLTWLSYPAIRHIGRISYGIYVYHYFVPQYLDEIGLLALLKHSAGGKIIMLMTEVAITLIVAELSWRLIEQPISKLRPLINCTSSIPNTDGGHVDFRGQVA